MVKTVSFLFAFFLASAAVAATDGNSSVFAAAYSTIAENHILPQEVEKVAIAGLRGLNDIDRNLTFANGTESVFLYYKGKQNGMWRKPKNKNDAAAWGKISAAVLKTASKKSPLAHSRNTELTDIILSKTAAALNDNSHYISAAEQEEDNNKNPGYSFVSRWQEGILYLKIGSFNRHSFDNVDRSLRQYADSNAIIIDLRGNRGGLINEAIEIARLFIDGGIIVSVKGRTNGKIKYYTAEDREETPNRRLVVLIDGETASSAEMLAAALQEQAQATLVGTQSFGKGSIQELYTFDNGGQLALTSAYFATPSGKNIDKKGLLPDYCTFGAPARLRHPVVENYKKTDCPPESRSLFDSDIEIASTLLQ